MHTTDEMNVFRPNKVFKKRYDSLFRHDPVMANLFLLLCELANEKGQVTTNEEEISRIMEVRFNDPREYSLKGADNG